MTDGATEPPPRRLVMGVLNVTPDSFSDGGRYLDLDRAVAHGRQLVAEGAAMVDVGGESTRPGAAPVPHAEEIARVVPVIEVLSREVRVSVDTRHRAVAEAAIAAGATLVNDVSASLHEVAAEAGVGWVAMHMRGSPATMQDDPRYRDVVGEVRAHLAERLRRAGEAGVAEVWLDPGIGFGKTAAHNLALLAHLDDLCTLGAPLLVGTSRKRFLGDLTARADGTTEAPPPEDRLEASVATAVWAFAHGATMVRAHDVAATCAAARIVGDGPPIVVDP